MNETESGFEISQDYSQSPSYAPVVPQSMVVRLILKTGIAHSEAAANKIAIGIAIICFSIAGYLAFGGPSSTPSPSAQLPAIGTPGPGGIPQP